LTGVVFFLGSLRSIAYAVVLDRGRTLNGVLLMAFGTSAEKASNRWEEAFL